MWVASEPGERPHPWREALEYIGEVLGVPVIWPHDEDQKLASKWQLLMLKMQRAQRQASGGRSVTPGSAEPRQDNKKR